MVGLYRIKPEWRKTFFFGRKTNKNTLLLIYSHTPISIHGYDPSWICNAQKKILYKSEIWFALINFHFTSIHQNRPVTNFSFFFAIQAYSIWIHIHRCVCVTFIWDVQQIYIISMHCALGFYGVGTKIKSIIFVLINHFWKSNYNALIYNYPAVRFRSFYFPFQ